MVFEDLRVVSVSWDLMVANAILLGGTWAEPVKLILMLATLHKQYCYSYFDAVQEVAFLALKRNKIKYWYMVLMNLMN